ncbi:L,D-carboxypeptidase A [Rhodanobacter panaciterrae]|uniref:L,D-carboxypeptidase A n=1 Tax=Rhodanobacter panaciterrae TaxID=490572 RepID=A0ABQ2ZGY8_9GAMM|nr:muramoyltetrapeptide carboxypeptidase [Rhodanobacter panaciterrae]GGY15129.1 L,D-carboxypeptidase A [Rhodanobacter panaciterrae]
MSDITIRLIAPSGYPYDPAAMTRGVARLREAGCVVDGLDVLQRTEQRFSGTDAERVADINALATMGTLPDIALVTRGGYGASRLLPHLDYDALRERLADASTLLVGHSDFTALQLALYAKTGLYTFSGPLLADLGAESCSEFTWQHFWDTLTSPASTAAWPATTTNEIDVQGPLWGGNLAVLCSLLGTPYFPQIEGGILFVEDVGEPPFRIERWLYQLHLSGVLGRQRALVLGDFSHCQPSARDNGYDLAAAFAQIRAVAGIPVVGGMPHGHGEQQLTLPFSAPARLRVAGGRAQLDFSGYPHLNRPAPASAVENP